MVVSYIIRCGAEALKKTIEIGAGIVYNGNSLTVLIKARGGMSMKKVLILSVTAGMGHNQTGLAVKNYLVSQGAACEMLDIYEYVAPLLGEGLNKGYLLSTKYLPRAYGQFYRLAEKRRHTEHSVLIDAWSRVLSPKLLKYFQHFQPDAIICTHIFAAELVTYMRRKGKIGCPLIGIVTDFTIHPFWEESELDYYVTASRLLNHQLAKKGIEPSKALPIGIPIHPKFGSSISKEQACAQLQIEDKLPTILVMMGSMGYGNILRELVTLDRMDAEFQILCVCGSNQRLHTMVGNHVWWKKMHCFGYVDNIDVMMDAADVIVTKPGGLTTSEFLAKGLPAILLDPIPGQEDRNVEFLLNNGLAIKASKTFPIDEAVYQLLLHGWRLAMLSQAAKFMGKPNAAQDLGDFVLDLIE